MKYLLAFLSFALMSSHGWANAPINDNFAKALQITGSPSGLSVGSLAKGTTYIITAVGTTDFTLLGADTNLAGTVFVATGPGSGTGTVNTVLSVSGSNVAATAETDEPSHGTLSATGDTVGGVTVTVGGGKSVWWAWKATASATVTIDTNGSSFDTVLAVYRGSSLAVLTPLAFDDDASATKVTSKVSFTVTQGTTYYIAVDGFKGATGSIVLHLAVGPGTFNAQNDNYVDRAIIGGEYAISTGSSLLGTIEPGETALGGLFFTTSLTANSVWWTWTAPRAGTVTIASSMLMNGGDGFGNFYGVLELYSATTNALSGLVYLTGDQGNSGNLVRATIPTVTRTVAAGEVLQMRISNYYTTNGAQITLTVAMDPTDFTNDNFAKRTLLTGTSAMATISNSLATAETGEPAHYEEVTADQMIAGETYMINSLGTAPNATDFTVSAVGSTSNALGFEFTTNGPGTGTGKALHLRPMLVADNAPITADKIVAGQTYVINTLGTTNWEAIGDVNIFFLPQVGDVFTATGPGTGTGTATLVGGFLTVGKTYRIEAVNGTDFTLWGAASNIPGTTFTATDTGAGDGTVIPVDVITAGSFVIGRNYQIESLGTTDFHAIGADLPVTVGETFQATGVGSGTGTASTPTASHSAWWTWVAPANGYVSINTTGSTVNTSVTPLDTLLKVYTSVNLGSPTLAGLVPVASNDDASTLNPTSSVIFQVVKGTAYQIAVDSGDDVRSTGSVNLVLSFTSDAPIITTQVLNQTAYVGSTTTTFTVSNTGAPAVYDWQLKAATGPFANTWKHVGDGTTQLPPAATPNGVATSTYTVPTIIQAMTGDQYRCVISNVAGQVISRTAVLTAVTSALYQGGSPSATDLGLTFVAGVTYYATGLPSGLTLDKTTGAISGRITAAPNQLYTIKYWSIDGSKIKSPVHTTVVYVNSFPATMTGSFEGILLNSGIPSGKVSLLVSKTGAFTGTLTYKDKVYSLRSALTLDSLTTPPAFGQATITPPGTALSLNVNLLASDSSMSATLMDGGMSVGTASDGVQLNIYPSAFPAPWAGTYTMVFGAPAVTPGAPEGSGYGLITIRSTGGLELRGQLADGTVVTAYLLTDVNSIGGYRPYIQLYANKLGYLAGTLQLQKRTDNKYHITAGSGSDIWWAKSAVLNDKSYPSGFAPLNPDVLMEPWLTPTKSYLIGLLGLLTPLDSQTIGNFNMTLSQSTLTPMMLTTPLKMNAVSKVSVLDPLTAPTGFTVTISPTTGAFTGSYTVSATDKRRVTVQGALLQFQTPASGNAFGQGFFLVPPVVTRPPSGSIISGNVQFTIP